MKALDSFIAGVDIGGTKMQILLTDASGNERYKKKVPTLHGAEPADFLAAVLDEIYRGMAELNVAQDHLAGIGMGLPGCINSAKGIAYNCTALGWDEVNVHAILRAWTNAHIFIENDVKISALGEQWKGAAKGIDDFVMLTVGTGIGCAAIVNGVLCKGTTFSAGEIGYFVLNDDFTDDFYQDYSRFGSFESAASGTGITERARQILSMQTEPSVLRTIPGVPISEICTEHVLKEAEAGDLLALHIMKKPVRYMAVALANVISLLNPKCVVIGGGVAESGSFYLNWVEREMNQLSPNQARVVPAALKNEAGAYGAVAGVLNGLGAGK